MNFEHLVQINDPLNPLLETISREQLWLGLVLRAEQPHLFVPSLDGCTILSRTDTTLERELRYGATLVRDRVTLSAHDRVHYEIAPTADYVGGSLTMTIEQPDELQLFLRFKYATTLPEGSSVDEEQTREIVKSAYRESDLDTVKMIRQLVHTGSVSGTAH